jgi:hypothetical protein
MIRKRLAAIGKNKSVVPNNGSSKIIKLDGEAMTPYLALLLDITINNATIPDDWKTFIVFPIYKVGATLVSNYRPVSLTSVDCKQMEHVITSYLRKIWNKKIGYSRVNMDSRRDIHAKVK